MAVIRDMMPAFELFQPTSVEGALEVLGRHGSAAWVLAGGLDSFDWLKDRTKRPGVVVDLSQVEALRGIREVDGGLAIGATTTLTTVAQHPVVRERFGVLAEAAALVASPQIRHQGTLGGNVSQDTRCWDHRSGWSCYRAGGNICYADTPTAINREHAILGADRCVAVSPSDTAPALIALDAVCVVRGARGTRAIPAAEFFVGPGVDITRMTRLGPGELLTTITIPGTWAGAAFYFEKVRDRNVWDFPLVNVAAALRLEGATIAAARLAVGAVAARPLRLTTVEAAVTGQPRTEATAARAGELAVAGATALRYNVYKIPLMRNLVMRAIRGAGGPVTTGATRIDWHLEDSYGLPDMGRNPWGQQVLTHVSWDLLWASLFAGLMFLVAHASYMILSAHRKRSSAETDALEAANKDLPELVTRHTFMARVFHWMMAASMFVLLFTAFLPIAGIRFAWVQWHWMAGLVLTGAIIYHIVHATFFLDFWSIWIGPKDIPEFRTELLRELGRDVPGPKSAKYPLGNRLYHLAILVVGMSVSITGMIMMSRVRQPLFTRDPYIMSDASWGWTYVLHGACGVALVGLVIAHVYFAVRPDKWWITKAMIFGAITRREYLEHHDPARWNVRKKTQAAGRS